MGKHTVLFKFVARQLGCFIQTFSIQKDSAEAKRETIYTYRIDLGENWKDLIFADDVSALSDPAHPLIIGAGENVLYGLVRAEHICCLIGPVLCPLTAEFRSRFENVTLPKEDMASLAACSLPFFADQVLLLFNYLNDQEMSLQECLLWNSSASSQEEAFKEDLSREIYSRRENSSEHNPYDHEVREMLCIELGDEQGLRRVWEEQYSGSFGTISKDMARNGRYLSVVVVTLATRAAMRGGLLPELAMSVGDVYMQKIDTEQNLYELPSLTRNAELELLHLVKKAKEKAAKENGTQEHLLIVKTRQYVFSHLHEKLTVSKIAEELGVHPGYLSALFHRFTGEKLSHYIQEEKISLVKTLLVYSDQDLSGIAQTLGFASQSHLGDVFKTATGCTLRQYRRMGRETAHFKEVSDTDKNEWDQISF